MVCGGDNMGAINLLVGLDDTAFYPPIETRAYLGEKEPG